MSKLTKQQVEAKLAEVDRLLEEIAKNAPEYVSWEGPTYGMGGWVESGEWQASSQSC